MEGKVQRSFWLPKEQAAWLRLEAAKQSTDAGRNVPMHQLVAEGIEKIGGPPAPARPTVAEQAAA